MLLVAVLAFAAFATANTTVFDEGVSLQYLHYSYAAFCEEPALKAWSCEWCVATNFTVVDVLLDPLTEVYGFVGYDTANSTIVVSFRGTSNTPNAIVDADFDLMDFPGIAGAKVHQGFYLAWRRLQHQVFELIDGVLNSTCAACTAIVTTGHSLGAALSGVAAIEIALNYKNATVNMNNFGMPRIGNPEFATAFMQLLPNAQRMVHNHDIVPHVPMIELGYHHPAFEIWDLNNVTASVARYIVCNDSGEDPACSDSIPALQWSTADHMNYMGVQNDCCGTC
eukprot:m.424518 g.424518  ORF g.424518 m.424518 type:complete len:281 (+) comp56673_c0_seq2:65-907(+)